MPHLERLMAMESKQGHAEPKQVDEAQMGEDLSNSATIGAERCALTHAHVGAIRPTHPHRHL
jgi:hypothetical protein